MISKNVLNNGLTVLCKKTNTESITIEVCVKAGCVYEPDSLMGVSHFLEHMLFNGTKNRTQLQISSEIENLGGEINAATTNDRTFFYVKILKKYFHVALDVISDMILNSNFPEQLFEREKGIVLDEINMVHDTPRHHQFILFQEALFKNHPAQRRILGTTDTITNLSRTELINYYDKMYVPSNMIVTVIGDVIDAKDRVESKFKHKKDTKVRFEKVPNHQTKKNSILETRKIAASYLVMGYVTPKRTDPESYVFDIIKAILGRGQSGWIFDEVRNRRGLCYDCGVHVESTFDYGLIAIYVNSHKKNFEQVKKVIFEQFERLQKLTEEELQNAKNFIEGEFILEHEDTQEMADEISFHEMCGDFSNYENYTSKIKKVSLEEIKQTAKKYLTKNYAEAIIQQE